MELLVRCDWGLRLYPKAFLIKKVWFEVHESIINLKDFDLLLEERLSAEAEGMRFLSEYKHHLLYPSTSETSIDFISELNSLIRLNVFSIETPCLDFLEGFMFPRLLGYDIAINTMLARYIKTRCSRLLTFTAGFLLKVISELLWNVEFLQVVEVMDKENHMLD
ncbi:hypothetical protein GOBAR_DD00757 [Gossypium barbadense]|nr:hypothetical protein GOBAR_DD00757 [Gossypium barbadense]